MEFKNIADVVLIDSSPMIAVTDASILSNYVDGVVLVVDAGKARAREFRRWVREMQRIQMQIPFIGVVLNRVSNHRRAYYNYYRKNDQAERNRSLRLMKNKLFSRQNQKKYVHLSKDEESNSEVSMDALISNENSDEATSGDIHGTLEEAYQISPPDKQIVNDDL